METTGGDFKSFREFLLDCDRILAPFNAGHIDLQLRPLNAYKVHCGYMELAITGDGTHSEQKTFVCHNRPIIIPEGDSRWSVAANPDTHQTLLFVELLAASVHVLILHVLDLVK